MARGAGIRVRLGELAAWPILQLHLDSPQALREPMATVDIADASSIGMAKVCDGFEVGIGLAITRHSNIDGFAKRTQEW